MLAAVVMVTGIGIRGAAAEPARHAGRADTTTVATALASPTPDAAGSCAVESTAIPALAMMSTGRARAADGALPSDPPTLTVSCALPYVNGKPGGDCTGKHTIDYKVLGAGPNAKITAELLALDTGGNLLNSFLVNKGDTAHLVSRLPPSDWKFQHNGREYSVFAPVPLLRVTVEDQGQKAEAYCSNIPWVDVIQPNGGVVTESSGSAVDVLAAVPLTNPSLLHVYVDGDDLLADVPNFLGCTTAAPCDGAANINGQLIGYTNLIVDIASGITSLASNTVRVSLHDLSCGGHFVRVSTSMLPGTLKDPTTTTCNVDDLTDKGSASIFAITITDPVQGQITPIVPTPVAGEVCSGTPIVDVNINGKALSVAGQTHVPGDGETTGDLYTVVIDTTLDATDLVRDVLDTQDAPLGTFDAGTNRLAASAREELGNRTYETLILATGAVAPIGVDPSAVILDANGAVFQEAALQATINEHLKQALQEKFPSILNATETELANAFIVGITSEGAQTLFNKLCTAPLNNPASPHHGKTPGQIFSETVTNLLEAHNQSNPLVNNAVWTTGPCSCNPTFDVFISDVTVGTDVACPIVFSNGQIAVSLELPDVVIEANALGVLDSSGKGCQTDACICNPFDPDDCACVCIARTTVNVTATASVGDVKFTYTITENDLMNTTTSNPSFTTAAAVGLGATGGIDVDCLGEVCNILLDAFVTVLTFGQVDIGPLLEPQIDITTLVNFEQEITPAKPDAIPLKEIKVDESVVANFDQKLSGILTEVHINTDGITAGLKGKFATLVIDEGVESMPGITLTPAPVPTMSEMKAHGVKDALIGLSDDSINMMFASLTAAGKLKAGDSQGCVDTGATVGSLLPADCDALTIAASPGYATAVARGYCHAIRENDCGLLAFGADPFLTATEQGVCYGASGAVCSAIAGGNGTRWSACVATPNFGLVATQPLLFCAKGDVPPRMLFPNTGTPGGLVPTALRLNDFTVGLVIDRTENHVVDGALADAPGCFAAGASTAVDCRVFAACLDLNLNFGMQFQLCPDGKPGFKSTFDSIQILNREVGVVCSGATSPTNDADVLDTASDDLITIPIGTNAGQLSPPICGAGLDMGGFVTCDLPEILTVEADGAAALRDYLGITCKIQP